jgi:thiol-disulfide isomerase/thioredoxin
MGRAVIVAFLLVSACSGRVVRFDAPTTKTVNLSHADFETLLSRYVDASGGVDYEQWHHSGADIAALDHYLGRMTNAPPARRPDLFTNRAKELTYWVSLYNALVVREVLRHWPLDTVGDIKPTLSSKLIPRRGFFRDTYFVIGGKKLNLDDIEHQVLRKTFRDARLHFAINCGSASCPILQGFGDDDIDAQLDQAARQFINDPGNVRVDHKGKTIRLSKLFDWYEDDFVAAARRRAQSSKATTLDFVAHFADKELAARLRRARASGYRVAHFEYDWSVNRGERDERIGSRVPDVAIELLDGGTFRPGDHRGKVVVIDFWATYCKACREGLVELAELAAQHPDELVVIAVSEDDDPSLLPAYLDTLEAAPTIGIDRDQNIAETAFSVKRLPTQILVDRQGVIRAIREGKTEISLAEQLTELRVRP